MPRSDLLIRLIQSGVQNDKFAFRKVCEAIIAEERVKQHAILADKLEGILKGVPSENAPQNGGASMSDQRVSGSFYEIIPRRSLSEIVLTEDVLQSCESFIKEQHRVDLLRSYNLEPRNRILLIGPPGNGKTSLAEAIAEALSVPLYVVRYESLIGSYLGETATRLKKLFEYVSMRQCVLFFDEFETLGKERGDIHDTGEIKRVVSSLLLYIDSLPSHVVVVCATNHQELLDRAVWRRFQIRLNLLNPTKQQLLAWLKKFEIRVQVSLGCAHDRLAGRLLGASFSEVEEFCLTVFRQYVLESPGVSIKDLVDRTLKQWSFGAYKPKFKAKGR